MAVLTVDRDAVFKAIAHPARREIIALLAISARSVTELTARFNMSQPAVSQHLRELRDAHLVTSDRVGLEQRYRLTPHPLQHVVEWTEPYRTLRDPSGHAWLLVSNRNAASSKKRRKSNRHGR